MKYTDKDIRDIVRECELMYELCRQRIAISGTGKSTNKYERQMGTAKFLLGRVATDLILDTTEIENVEVNKLESGIDYHILALAEMSAIVQENEDHLKITDEAKDSLWRIMSAIESRREGVLFSKRQDASRHISKQNAA
jgi:hypothetical protein